MPQTAPRVQSVSQPSRVRPLWERDALFKEPQYENGTVWSAQDDDDDDD